MKQKKRFGILAMILLCLPQLLSAQKKSDAFSSMKPGDWFEVLVSDTTRMPNSQSDRFNIKYLLKKVDPNGSREYNIIFERIRSILSYTGSVSLGYDSYYPPYKQGLPQKTVKPSFSAKVDKSGKVLSMKPDFDFPEIDLYEIAPRKVYGSTSVTMKAIHVETSKFLSEILLKAIASHKNDWYNGSIHGEFGLNYLLSAASFQLEPNILIEGKIKNMTQKVRDGLYLNLPWSDQKLNIQKDGSFSIKTFLAEGNDAKLSFRYLPEDEQLNKQGPFPDNVDVKIKLKKIDIPLFLQPGDTLYISADGNDFGKSLEFSGNAAKKANYALEIAKYEQTKNTPNVAYSVRNFSANIFMQAQQLDENSFRQLSNKYNYQLPVSVVNYYHTRFAFEQANERLDFLFNTSYRSDNESDEMMEDFPNDFFKGIDSLPVLMVDYKHADWYKSFLHGYHLYLTAKMGKYNGGIDGFFLGDYISSLDYLRRFPLYSSLADAFEKELVSNSWKYAQTLKPYYEDFINNCGDTALTNGVKRKWQTLSTWAPGNQLPLKTIKLADGKLLDFSKFKGKALSITFNFHYPDEIKRLLERIKAQDPAKVHFIIVQLNVVGFPASTVSDELKKLPQVTYVEVTQEGSNIDETVLLKLFDIKTFVLDADQRIIEDNINESPNKLPQDDAFNKALQRALAPKKMNKEQKAELIKTIGWSAGSILFASLIFFWIYKLRVSTIKRRESLKRQIKELEIKAIRSQMNPHFIFNAMNSIQSLVNSNQLKEANVYLEKFSLLMRRVLNNSEKSFVSLSDEIAAVTVYMELEKLRFDFAFEIKADKHINTDLIEIPGMITQPLIENAILHGIARKGTTGMLKVLISKEGSYLKIVVIDNGDGLKENINGEHKGFGLKLVRDRLKLLSTQDTEGKLEISGNIGDNTPGVTATLVIPID